VGNFRAVLTDSLIAFFMNFLDIIPENLFIILISLLVNAHLSQILQYNFRSCDILRPSFLSTIFAPSKTVGLSELIVTFLALPKDKSRGHQNLVSKSSVNFCKILYKVKSNIVA